MGLGSVRTVPQVLEVGQGTDGHQGSSSAALINGRIFCTSSESFKRCTHCLHVISRTLRDELEHPSRRTKWTLSEQPTRSQKRGDVYRTHGGGMQLTTPQNRGGRQQSDAQQGCKHDPDGGGEPPIFNTPSHKERHTNKRDERPKTGP